MGLIMEEKYIIKSIKREPVEVIIVDEISSHSVSDQIGVAIKQEPEINSLKSVEVKSEFQDVNEAKPFVSAIKEEDDSTEAANLKHDNVITTNNISVKFEPFKFEEIEITEVDSSNDEEQGTKKPYTCNICGYKSALRDTLRSHIQLHIGEKPYKCDKCEYSTSLKDIFKEHMLSHNRDKHYECEICDFSFSQRDNLLDHILTHTGEKSYKCTTKRRNHGNTHHTKKPFKCNKCEYGAETKIALRNHTLTHSDKKLLECYTCGHKTPSKGHLRQHVRIHFGNRVKSYKCNACKTRFLYKSSLLKHMRFRPCKPGHS